MCEGEKLMDKGNRPVLKKDNVEDILPLSKVQKSMLYSYLMDTRSYKYFEQWRYKIKGNINIKKFQKAWNYVINNNDMLKCVFRWEGLREPVQIILKKKQITIEHHDLSKMESVDAQLASDNIARSEWKRKVDLKIDPIRVVLNVLSDTECEMIVSSHHIILDGWSNAILLKELALYYNHIFEGREINLQPKYRFKNYILNHSPGCSEDDYAFWQGYLKGYKHRLLTPDRSVKSHAHEGAVLIPV